MLKDGSTISCEVEFEENSRSPWLGQPLRVTYYHGNTEVSLEGMKHLRKTIGLSERVL